MVDGFWTEALLASLGVAFCVMLFSLVFALPAAWLFERSDLPGGRRFLSFFTLSYILPSYLLAISWITLANPVVGWLNLWARDLLGVARLVDIYGLGGIIFIESAALYPILFLSFRAGLKQMDPALEEAAKLCGASNKRVFFSITLPLLKNSVIAGLIAVALSSIASFGVPAMIGAPKRAYVLTTGIFSLLRQGSAEGMNEAFRVSAYLSLGALALVALSSWLSRKKSSLLSGKSSRPTQLELGPARWPLAVAIWGLWALLVGLPLVTLVISSFQHQPGALVLSELSLDKWKYVLFELPDFKSAILTSIWSSVGAAIVVLVLSLVISLAAWKGHFQPRWRMLKIFSEGGQGFASLVFSLPGTVLALALIFVWSRFPSFSVSDTIAALIVAYTLKYMLLGLKTIEPAAFLVHPSLLEAARLSGAGVGQRLWRIWLPLLRPAIVAAALLVLMPCLSELTMSILLQGPGTQNLGVLIFQLQEYADRPSAAVVGSLLLGSVMTLQFLIGRVSRES